MRGRRFVATVLFLSLGAGALLALRLGYVERLRDRVQGRAPRLTAGDFPAGVTAPVDDVASIPTRPLLVGVTPRGTIAPLVWAAGDAERPGLFRSAYALDVKVVRFDTEDGLRRALVKGGDNGGVDVAALSVSTLGMSAAPLRDAAPRTVLLLGRSRGQDVLATRSGTLTPAQLKGRRLATEPRSPGHYFALWVLSRAGLSMREVTWVPLESSLQAGATLQSGKADVVAGLVGDVHPMVRELGGSIMATTADAPHLLATVLVARGDFAARYPDAVRRLLRGALDAGALVVKAPEEAARVLGSFAPQLGDPSEAILAAPPATMRENLAFFGLSGEAPVTYAELYQSAVALAQKLTGPSTVPTAEETADLGALKYVSATQRP
ncbi:MAG: ABC transporter substrate-binding protein [Myxococcaceae bacterium]|nr:ABC transporter substrate-binding protein [Myxococcaceae bacterium]